MTETGILREVYVEGKEDRTFQPALDTHKISVGMVLDRIDAQGTEQFLQSPTPEMQAFWEHYVLAKKAHTSLDKIYVNEL